MPVLLKQRFSLNSASAIPLLIIDLSFIIYHVGKNMVDDKLLDTVRVSKSSSLRISLPKRVATKIRVGSEDIIGFYLNKEGEVVIRKML